MIIERFKDGTPVAVGERYKKKGRMLPEGVSYVSSWMDATGAACFQLMDAPNAESLSTWTARWEDLVDFEIVPVMPSTEFWSKSQTA